MEHDNPASDRPAFEIEITDEMFDAAEYAARDWCLGMPLRDLFQLVYVAMIVEARLDPPPPQ